MGVANLVENKKIFLNYEVLDEYESGIELLGAEVKMVKSHHGSLEGARVIIRGNEAFLVGANIPLYQPNNPSSSYEPDRTRRLLLKKEEIAELVGRGEQKGLTIVPISMYNKSRLIKVRVAVVRGKKKFDKRESLKKKEARRDVARDIKGTLKS